LESELRSLEAELADLSEKLTASREALDRGERIGAFVELQQVEMRAAWVAERREGVKAELALIKIDLTGLRDES
jgi:hypothetical protein